MKISAIKILMLAMMVLLAACSSKGRYGPNGELISDQDLAGQYDARFADGEIPSAEGAGLFRDIFFDYDSSSISENALQDIEYNLEVMRSYPEMRIQIEGHCDERGTAEYNVALGSKRALVVSDALVSLGGDASRISTVSYGEELPLDPGFSESAFSQNRRAHLAAFN